MAAKKPAYYRNRIRRGLEVTSPQFTRAMGFGYMADAHLAAMDKAGIVTLRHTRMYVWVRVLDHDRLSHYCTECRLLNGAE